jgi:hypothetical protein
LRVELVDEQSFRFQSLAAVGANNLQ